MKRPTLLLFCIVGIGAILRFAFFTSVPPALSHDEVAIGYNAYAVLRTGRDEYGTLLPLLFRSFDDYKLPGMVYITTIPIALFGLNEVGIRLPSAFLGTLSVIVFYFLMKEFLSDKKALVPTFFFAISPWHINFSRQLFESNGAVFFVILGTLFLVKSSKRTANLPLAAFFYGISLYFYYSVRLVIPFILVAFLLVCRNSLKNHKKHVLFSIIIGTLVILPLLPNIFSKGGFTRIQTVSVNNDKQYIERVEKYTRYMADNPTNIIFRIIYNRRIAFVQTIAENYLKNISFEHIFQKGTGSYGLLHIPEIPFFYLGVISLLLFPFPKKWILLAWAFAAELPGALSLDQPNSLRTLLNAPMFSFFSGFGTLQILAVTRTGFIKHIVTFLLIIFFGLSMYSFITKYYQEYPNAHAMDFGDGQKQMAQYVGREQNNYEHIYISGYYWRPYIFLLFWNQIDPVEFQKKGDKNHFGKYSFGKSSWDKEGVFFGKDDFISHLPSTISSKNTLFIFAPWEYEKHRSDFQELSRISGRYTKDIFIAAKLK